MEINDERLEAELAEMKQKEKLELEILKLSYEITEKKKNIFKKSEWTFKDLIGPILTALTLIVSVTSIFISFKIQSKQLEINTHIQGSTNLRELLSWVVDPSRKKHDMAMQQLKYYGSQTLPVYLDAIVTDTVLNADDMANNISFIINLSCENEIEKQQVIYDFNSFFKKHLFQKIENDQLLANKINSFSLLLNNKIYPIFNMVEYNSIKPNSLCIYDTIKINSATTRLTSLFADDANASDLKDIWIKNAKSIYGNKK
jgi:hypothetical protein